jgi:peptidoglycan/xylan/chitin deacetylase (PgdA/CDA1 family)
VVGAVGASRKVGWFTWGGVTAVVALLLLSGHLLGRMSARTTPAPSRSAAVHPGGDAIRPEPSASPIRLAANRSAERTVPITGPNRPPLPRERTGPFGSRITTGLPDVALTFDDGPDPDWTPRVLEMLRQYNIRATFCVIGVNVQEFRGLVRDIVAGGHTLCNHSWAHDIGLGRRPLAWIMADLRRTNAAIRQAAPDAKISYYRQPGGTWTPTVVAAAARLGMSALHWQVDPQDWRKPGSYAISSVVIAATRPGSIVLMHDGGGNRSGTLAALHAILPNFVARFQMEALPPGVDPPRLYGIDLPLHSGQS